MDFEHEIRFYYNKSELEKIIEKLKNITELHSNLKLYEKTIHYNHIDPNYDFYNQSVNGKLRLRVSRNELINKCKLSWKQHITPKASNNIDSYLEKEVKIDNHDIDNLIYIIEKVMNFIVVESYERYRYIFENNDIEIAVDEYPFGVCLEIANKSLDKEPTKIIKYWLETLGLNIEDASNLSWNTMYKKLCHDQAIDPYQAVSFDQVMPVINKSFIENN